MCGRLQGSNYGRRRHRGKMRKLCSSMTARGGGGGASPARSLATTSPSTSILLDGSTSSGTSNILILWSNCGSLNYEMRRRQGTSTAPACSPSSSTPTRPLTSSMAPSVKGDGYGSDTNYNFAPESKAVHGYRQAAQEHLECQGSALVMRQAKTLKIYANHLATSLLVLFLEDKFDQVPIKG